MNDVLFFVFLTVATVILGLFLRTGRSSSRYLSQISSEERRLFVFMDWGFDIFDDRSIFKRMRKDLEGD